MILIVGYPKSGNTWLCRLVAELVDCPYHGFLGQPNAPDIGIEGDDRVSRYAVFKGHQPFTKAYKRARKASIIHMVRDVRDVVISGAPYFPLMRFPFNNAFARTLKVRCVRRICRKFFALRSEQERIQRMIHIVDKGSLALSWHSMPWDKYVEEYLQQDVLTVRYEDLLLKPIYESKRILLYIGLERDDNKIRQVVHNQSFEVRKKRALAEGDARHIAFLRKGFSGSWRDKLTSQQKEFLKKRFFNTLKRLNYLY